MKRFFKELRNPILKCVRVGHKEADGNDCNCGADKHNSVINEAIAAAKEKLK